MPTYGYRCKKCEHQFEIVQRMSDEPIKVCPECSGALTKILFPVGVVFKGSGFHVNDYPSSGSRVSSQVDKAAETKSVKTEETKTEAKPAPTPAEKN